MQIYKTLTQLDFFLFSCLAQSAGRAVFFHVSGRNISQTATSGTLTALVTAVIARTNARFAASTYAHGESATYVCTVRIGLRKVLRSGINLLDSTGVYSSL